MDAVLIIADAMVQKDKPRAAEDLKENQKTTAADRNGRRGSLTPSIATAEDE